MEFMYSMGLSTYTQVASGPNLSNPILWMQRDSTRKYHAQIFRQELAFRDRLSHFYASSSEKELVQQEFSKSPNQILQQECSKNLQQNSSRSPDSVLPEQPGWCSLSEVDSKTEEVLQKHKFIDKQVLMSKELKEGSDNGRERNSEQQKTQTEQLQQERDINDNLEKQEKSMKNDGIPLNECKRSLNSNQLTIEECVTCNEVFNFQDDFESHLAGRKHAEQLLQRITCVKALSEVKDDSKKCENAGEKKLVSIESGLLAKDNVEKRLEKELVWKVKDNGDLVAREDKVGMKENAERNEQQQIMVGVMPSKLCKRSLNLSQLSIEQCKISYVKGDEQKSAENKPVWKVKDDSDLVAEINEVDMKENAEWIVIEQHQMKQGNSKQEKVQIEEQMKEGNSKRQKPQMEQQMKEGNSKQQKPQMEQQMMEGGVLSKEHERSLDSNQLKHKKCVICNIILKFQVDFEAHLSGRKHAKQLKKLETGLVQKVADDRDFDAQSNKVGMKETAEHELEQTNTSGVSSKICKMEQQMMEGGIPSKEYGRSLNSNPLKIKECVICNIELKFQVDFEAHFSGRKHARQLKKIKTKLVQKVADDSDFGAKSNKVGMKETDEHEQEQMNTRGVSSKMCKMLSNARQLSIEECKISKEKDDVDKRDKNKLVWKVKDDRNLGAKRNKVDMKENAELNEQCLMKEGNSKQQKFQSEQKMEEGKSKQQMPQMQQQMKEGNSKKQKLQMKQQMTEIGLPYKQHEGSLTSEQLKVNGYIICDTALNFQGDVEAELARKKHAKKLKKMENKPVWKARDERDLCTKSNKVSIKETAELSEKQHMKGGGMPSKICKSSSNASQLSINKFKIPITKDKVDKGAINQPVWKANEQQWIKKTNSKQQKLQTEQQLQEKNIMDNLEKR